MKNYPFKLTKENPIYPIPEEKNITAFGKFILNVDADFPNSIMLTISNSSGGLVFKRNLSEIHGRDGFVDLGESNTNFLVSVEAMNVKDTITGNIVFKDLHWEAIVRT